MHAAVPVTAPLSKLDRFLRDTWLECCGHLSAFEIGSNRYASSPTQGEMSMRVPLSRVLEKGIKFSYEYDYGSTTALTLKGCPSRAKYPERRHSTTGRQRGATS
jgi:hypothetical protein